MSDSSEGILTGTLNAGFGSAAEEFGAAYIQHRCAHDFPQSVGRDNWTIELSVPFVIEAVRLKLIRIREIILGLNVENQSIEEALRLRTTNWRHALVAKFRFSDDLMSRAIVMHYDTDQATAKAGRAIKWLQFLSAMPKDAKVSLNQNDFAYFFPGDTYADMTNKGA